jgi:hypothetical protein
MPLFTRLNRCTEALCGEVNLPGKLNDDDVEYSLHKPI